MWAQFTSDERGNETGPSKFFGGSFQEELTSKGVLVSAFMNINGEVCFVLSWTVSFLIL